MLRVGADLAHQARSFFGHGLRGLHEYSENAEMELDKTAKEVQKVRRFEVWFLSIELASSLRHRLCALDYM